MEGSLAEARMTSSQQLEGALQVVARHREHDAYGDENGLVKALRRRLSTIDQDDAVTLLRRANKLYDAAVIVAAQNVSALWNARTGGPLRVPDEVRNEMRRHAPGESDTDYDETLSWVFYVNHLR
jgi:hypothetical protein